MSAQPKPQPARIRCLRCDKFFKSRDKITNRLCSACKRQNAREHIPRTVPATIYPNDRAIEISGDDR